MKNADDLEVMPDNVDDEGLKEAYEEAAQHNWSKEEYDAYIYAGIRKQDERGRIELAEQKRIERVVIQMHKNNIPISIIASSVELSQQEVQTIIDNQQNT